MFEFVAATMQIIGTIPVVWLWGKDTTEAAAQEVVNTPPNPITDEEDEEDGL